MPLPSELPSHWKLRAGVLLSAFELPSPTFRTWIDRDGLELTGEYRILDAIRIGLLRELADGFQIKQAHAVLIVREADQALRLAADKLDDEGCFLDDRWPVIHVPHRGHPVEWFAREDAQTLASLRSPKLIVPLREVTQRAFLAVERALERAAR